MRERVGVDVDTDQNVHPFEVSFTLGALLPLVAIWVPAWMLPPCT